MTKAEAGRLGGLATHARYGHDHMSRIGRIGAHAFWRTYTLVTHGISQLAIVRRSDGSFVNLMSGQTGYPVPKGGETNGYERPR